MRDDDSARIAVASAALKNIIMEKLPAAGNFATSIPGFFLVRKECPLAAEHSFERPLVSLVAQGSKRIIIGKNEYMLGAGQVLTVCLDMPSFSQTIETDKDNPFLSIYFYLDPQMITELILQLGISCAHPFHQEGVSIANADADFIEGILRLARLDDKKEQIAARAPMILRELHYLLLAGPQKDVLAGIFGSPVYGRQIFEAIDFLKKNLSGPIRAGDLANAVYMSESTLYRHFKTLTGLSPLQYHKRLRLYEARRLMLVEKEQAAIAAMKVGYESVAQFNREYKRLFGQPPHRSKKIGG